MIKAQHVPSNIIFEDRFYHLLYHKTPKKAIHSTIIDHIFNIFFIFVHIAEQNADIWSPIMIIGDKF